MKDTYFWKLVYIQLNYVRAGGAHAPTVSAPLRRGHLAHTWQRTMTSRQFIGGDSRLAWVEGLTPEELAVHDREMAQAQEWHDSLTSSLLSRTYSGLPEPAQASGGGGPPPAASAELARVASLMEDAGAAEHAPNITEAQLAEIWGEEMSAGGGAVPPPPKVRRRLRYKKYKGG